MKYKSKIVISAILTILLAFLLKSVSAVDIVYQAIYKYKNSDERQIVYRTVVKPHSSTLDNTTFAKYNTWYYGVTNSEPTWGSYKTNYLIFTKKQIGSYTVMSYNKNSSAGYARYSVKLEGYTSFFSDDIKDVAEWVNKYANADKVSAQSVVVKDNEDVFDDTPLYKYDVKDGVPRVVSMDFGEEAFGKYMNNTIQEIKNRVHFASVLSDKTVSKNGEWVIPAYNQYPLTNGVVEYKTLRCMLYTNDSGLANSTPNSSQDSSKVYYIMDILLDTDTTNALYAYKSKDPENNKIYVSGISETKATLDNNSQTFYMLTPGAWLYSKVRPLNGQGGWSTGTSGTTENGLQSGLNLWDNILDVPLDEKQDKRIVVNHIAVNVDNSGEKSFELINTDVETLSVTNNWSDTASYKTVDSLYLDSSKNLTTDSANTKLLKSKSALNNGMIKYTIATALPTEDIWYKVDDLVSLGIIDTVENSKYIGYTYKGCSVDKDKGKMYGIEDYKSAADAYYEHQYKDNIELQLSTKFQLDENQNEVIVNLYYEAETRNVTVLNKLCADSNLATCKEVDSNIKNYTLIEGNRRLEINYSNTEKNINRTKTLNWEGAELTEEYIVNKAYNVKVSSVSNNAYKYKGYIVRVGSEVIENFKSSDTVYESTYDIKELYSKGDIVIEFYYVRGKSTTKKVTIENEDKPKIDIPGTLTIKSAVGVSTTCSDEEDKDYYSVPTNSEDGKSDIYVGIKNTPTYILAGIDVQEQEVTNKSVKINLTIRFGPNSKKWTIEVPYEISYYAIQNLLVYKYQNAVVSNAGSTNTSGNTLFSKNTLNISPVKTSALTLFSAVNSNIPYAKSGWTNLKYYLKTSFKTNYTIPTDNPEDVEENDSERKSLWFNLYMGYGYNTSMYYSPYEEVDNSVNEYISVELAEQYKEIELGKEANISIVLLSEDEFNKINGDTKKQTKNGKSQQRITVDDLTALKNATDKAKEKFEEAKINLGTAEDDYKNACGSRKFPCFDEVKEEYQDAKENRRTYQSCDDEGNCTTKKVSCDDDTNCLAAKELYNEVKDLDKEWNEAKDNYDTALTNLETAYEREIFAIQNYDEVTYIQNNIWDKYYTMTNKDIAKLLKLNVKFDYSSGNAKLGDVELMTVQNHTLELKSDDDEALSGQFKTNKEDCYTQTLEASRQTLTDTQKQYYTNGIVGASWLPNSRDAVGSEYYTNNADTIPITRLNGTRVLAAKANYAIDATNKVGTGSVVQDNMYFERVKDEATNTIVETVFDVSSNSKFAKNYGVTQNKEVAIKQEKNENYNDGNVSSEEFNVYTPLVVTTEVKQDIDIIDQTSTNKYNGVDVIQANSTFTINFYNNKFNSSNKVYKSGKSDFTTRYRQLTYIKFEFTVTNVTYVGADGTTGQYGRKDANEWIGPIYGDYITAIPYLNTTQGESVTDETYKYYVIAAALNANSSWTEQLLAYIDTSLDDLDDENLIDLLKNACGYEGNNNLSYYADLENMNKEDHGGGKNNGGGGILIIVNRMYDFRVTDLKDLDWKNVFRNNEISSYVNSHSGIAYYAGLNKWNSKNPVKYNQIIGRTTDEIGLSPKRILPLGPYKNTDTTYISAPKMGYRFSFDFKVTGAMDDEKYIKIYPSFYYISKDGKKFYTEYTSGNEGIYLFYKNSNGQYVRVGSSSDTYKIQFTPNDGYRSLIQTDVKNLNSNVVTLGGLRELILKYTETSTTSVNDAAITYYGEYKLPNSTIAVKVDKNGKYDINKPLTDGYIGVVFDIQAHESSGVDLVYGKNSYKNQTNTSQWDYEGYLGMSKPGSEYSTTLKLEKGTWKIDNETYNKIKGTVILYDTDNRASDDFN